ncbi:DUF4124 domain-containing protein [Luteimonas aquatica]|uniref:DUF4124 domain-containing protein n=1 Tax=Luteimonas aquatica TaxID=450364 RepID=UPI001F59A21D|nr:DUF4124 domain-containing protein [Luteimonas aquatica]
MLRNTIFVLLALASPLAAHAQNGDVVIYRCTDAKGKLTIQNGTPCPKGAKQEKRTIQGPTVVPAYTPPPKAPAPPAPAKPEATPAAAQQASAAQQSPPQTAEKAPPAERLPPPPIFQCNTWDNDSYLSENGDPKPRCVTLTTTDLNGAPVSPGAACEMKTDQCQRVPDGQACEAWKKREREVESTWRHARAEDKQSLQEEFARVTQIYADSKCGQ